MSNKKITQAMVTALIASSLIETVKLGAKTTVVSCTLPNGFVIVESSSCVDPENYDHEMGKSICLKRIENKVWELEGYRLQCSLTPDIDKIARVCHEVNKAFCESIGDHSQVSFEHAPEWQKLSAANGVRFRLANPYASASAQHDAWLADKIADGWKYGPVKNPETKEHPCCVPYEQLPTEQKSKDYIYKAIVDALI